MPGRDPARGARDTGRTGGSIGGRESKGPSKDRDGGMRAPAGTGNAGYASGGSVGFKGNESKSLGRQISDLFGGPQAFANNPNAPHNQNRTGIIPSFPWASPGYVVGSMFDALNMGPISAGLTMANTLRGAVTGTTPEGMGQRIASAFGATRGPQGPDIAGGGVERGGQGGNMFAGSGYKLAPGYMQPQPTAPTVNPTPMPQTQITQPGYGNLTMPAKYLEVAPGYGAGVPGYAYAGPMKR